MYNAVLYSCLEYLFLIGQLSKELFWLYGAVETSLQHLRMQTRPT